MIRGVETARRPLRSSFLERHPSVPYVAPFAAFIALLAIHPYLSALGRWDYILRIVLLTGVLWGFSRHVITFRVEQWLGSVGLGIAVFVLWIAPDLLFPGYREHWLFQNSLTGTLASSIPDRLISDPFVLFCRFLRAVILVPIIEELFWRAWLMRWLAHQDFQACPLGTYSRESMVVTALLFASEHGPFWDVGLITGFIYNWWMVRTRSLGDCILTHAVTNACLSAYVIATGKWEYWL